MSADQPRSRRGRPRAGERAAREEAVLDAALAELTRAGWTGFTVTGVARAAGASKETLYAWFGNREGLVRRLIQRNADLSAQAVRRALEAGSADRDPAATLMAYAHGLLRLLTGPSSIVLNRAAMTSPALAEVLRREGRLRAGPLVETYLADRHAAGDLDCPEPAEAFTVLYGLVVRDLQIGVLLGASVPGDAELRQRAERAVALFLRLYAPNLP